MRVLLILSILMLQYSCKSKATHHKTETGSVIHLTDTIIVDTSNYKWEGDLVTLAQQRNQKHYTFEGLPLCDDSKGKFLDDAKFDKYGYYTPYAIQRTEGKDSLRIDFDVIANCCLNFTGDIDRKGDSLFLTYFLKQGSGGACDCSCDYRMTYVVKKQAASNRVIIIRKG